MSKSEREIEWVLCAGTMRGVHFVERVQAAADAGFRAVTLFPEDYLDGTMRDGHSGATMRALLEAMDIKVHQIDPLTDWFEPEDTPSEQLIRRAAHDLGATSINVSPAFAPRPEPSFLIDRLGALCQRMQTYGLSVDFEFLPWSTVPNLAAGVRVIDACGAQNLGLMLDSWHLFRSGGTVADLTPEVVQKVTGVQINDAPIVPRKRSVRDRHDEVRAWFDWAYHGSRTMGVQRLVRLNRQAFVKGTSAIVGESICRRCMPGDGDQPIPELLAALIDGGYDSRIGVEVFSSKLNRLPAVDLARRAMTACKSVAREL